MEELRPNNFSVFITFMVELLAAHHVVHDGALGVAQ